MTCQHARLFCEPCDHVSTQLDVVHFFAHKLTDIYNRQTAGDFTFIGILSEFDRNMRYAENS